MQEHSMLLFKLEIYQIDKLSHKQKKMWVEIPVIFFCCFIPVRSAEKYINKERTAARWLCFSGAPREFFGWQDYSSSHITGFLTLLPMCSILQNPGKTAVLPALPLLVALCFYCLHLQSISCCFVTFWMRNFLWFSTEMIYMIVFLSSFYPSTSWKNPDGPQIRPHF